MIPLRRRRSHAAIRRLLAEGMDEALDPVEATLLADHLQGCVRCRGVARGHEDGRRQLHALRERVPPRDLDARVFAALDREVTRETGRERLARSLGGSLSGRLRPVAAGATSVALLVIGARLLLAPAASAPTIGIPGDAAPGPTPFAVPVAELALLEIGSGGLTLYQASVSQVCPPAADACDGGGLVARSVVGIDPDLVPRGAALDAANRRIALLAEDALGADSVTVLALPPMADDMEPLGAGTGPDGRWVGVAATPAPAGVVPVSSPGPGGIAAATDAPALVLAIMDGVHAVGAPPAWSPDGQMLAFSAMPADRSHGPDVYLWRPGQERARPLSSDHRSWFASWSGDRIVVSRLERGEGPDTARTVLLDPITGTQEEAHLPGAWLPAVDPSGRFAVAWRGTLAGADAQVRPRAGGLALVDWTLVDPRASDRASGRPWASASAVASVAALAVQGAGLLAPAQLAGATRSDGARPDSPWLEAIEAGDQDAPSAVDWSIDWATSDTTFGYWVADVRGASWGHLTVLRVLAEDRRIDRSASLLGPTLARRVFTLGEDRIAWVAPAEDGTDGELRVRTWGEPGEGDLRVRDLRVREGVPAF